jgi:hypothetical protein
MRVVMRAWLCCQQALVMRVVTVNHPHYHPHYHPCSLTTRAQQQASLGPVTRGSELFTMVEGS